MFKLLLLVAAIAAVKTDLIEDKVINTSWKIIAFGASIGDLKEKPGNCHFGININRTEVVDCTCGPVKGHVVDTVRNDGETVKELFIAVESREDLDAIRQVTCDCPAGVQGDGDRIYVKQLDSDYIITAIDEAHKLSYVILGKTAPSQAKLQELTNAADVFKGGEKENWTVVCAKSDN